MSERWLVAMSGGVDSSVAAALLAREGHDVIGVTMDLGAPPSASTDADGATLPLAAKRCCGLPDAIDAGAVARTLGIRHYVANYREAFRQSVVEPFVDAYAQGETPIPCVACNRVLKFDLLLERARTLGARGVASGHYARIAPGPDGARALYRPRDREKDQTYFLFDLPAATLAEIRFPLGELCKAEVREVARDLALATADKPESQGICFIPDGDVQGALRRIRPETALGPGSIIESGGRELGQHRGAVGFTLGQRRGLGLSGGPWYVTDVVPAENRVVVDRAEKLRRVRVDVAQASWLDGAPPENQVRVQVRHRHRSVSARVESLETAEEAPTDGAPGAPAARAPAARTVRFHLDEPVWAPARGQAAVVYDADDERVLGGGWITGSA